MMRVLGSDVLFWIASHAARNQMIRVVLATPPVLLTTANLSEKARINAMLADILPVSSRAAGLRSDTELGKHLTPARLELVRAPTLIIAAQDDGYGTYASARYTADEIAGAKFFGFETGGHTWVGHDDEVMAKVLTFISSSKEGQGR